MSVAAYPRIHLDLPNQRLGPNAGAFACPGDENASSHRRPSVSAQRIGPVATAQLLPKPTL